MNDDTKACQTPLIDLLRSVPSDARQMIERGPCHHQNIPYGRLCTEAADTIERLESECEKLRGELRLADAIITREGNRNDALNECKDRCERLLGALVEAERGFDLAYDAAEKGLTDEVLLHCGAHSALISTALFQTAIKRRKLNGEHNELV